MHLVIASSKLDKFDILKISMLEPSSAGFTKNSSPTMETALWYKFFKPLCKNASCKLFTTIHSGVAILLKDKASLHSLLFHVLEQAL